MKVQFIEDCRLWYKRWSTWLAGLFATICTIVLANSTALLGVIDRVPEPWHTIGAVVLGLFLFVVPVVTAQLKQKNLEKKDG